LRAPFLLTFRLREHPAEEVVVTGSFDDWKKTVKLEKVDGVFKKTVELPKVKTQYKVGLDVYSAAAAFPQSPYRGMSLIVPLAD
jgi:1,4-alpha-glucan branching enzyme